MRSGRLTCSSRDSSSAESVSSAASRLSASCSSVRAPTTTEATVGRVSSHASATCAAETSWAPAISTSTSIVS